MSTLPKPKHKLGYTSAQAQEIVNSACWEDFCRWMGGQTMAMDDEGNAIFYPQDVVRYLDLKKTGRREGPFEWD